MWVELRETYKKINDRRYRSGGMVALPSEKLRSWTNPLGVSVQWVDVDRLVTIKPGETIMITEERFQDLHKHGVPMVQGEGFRTWVNTTDIGITWRGRSIQPGKSVILSNKEHRELTRWRREMDKLAVQDDLDSPREPAPTPAPAPQEPDPNLYYGESGLEWGQPPQQ